MPYFIAVFPSLLRYIIRADARDHATHDAGDDTDRMDDSHFRAFAERAVRAFRFSRRGGSQAWVIPHQNFPMTP